MTNTVTLKGVVPFGTVGICDKGINKLSKAELKRYIETVDMNSHCDIAVYIQGRPYIIEHSVVDHEHDFKIQSFEDYCLQYGDRISDYMEKFEIPYKRLSNTLKKELEYE